MAFPTRTVELALGSAPDNPTPSWTDVSAFVMSLSITRGRQYELDQIQTSTLQVRFKNGDRRFDPVYTGSPYYPNVVCMVPIRVSATWLGTTYYLFTGYVERWPLSWETPTWGSVSVTATDGLAVLNQALISGTFATELTGDRIAEVLTAASWSSPTPTGTGGWTLGTSQLGIDTTLALDTPNTNLDAGQTTMSARTIVETDNVSALSAIQDATTAERGYAFIDGEGRMTFHDRHHRFGESSLMTFTDGNGSTSSTRIRYTNAVPDYDITHVINEAVVTVPGGTPQIFTDDASKTKYLRRTLSLSPQLTTDAEAQDMAAFEVTLHKEPNLRFSSLTVTGGADTNAWPYLCGLEIGDRVTVERTPVPGTSTITRDCFIEGVTHTLTADTWSVGYQLSPASVYDQFFVLGTSQLGTSTTLAY